METKRFVSKYKNPLLKYLDEMNTTMFFVLMFVGIFVVIGGLVFLSDNTGSNRNSDNGYKTNCYTRSDGKRCCKSCKKTSYGDVGCGITCN